MRWWAALFLGARDGHWSTAGEADVWAVAPASTRLVEGQCLGLGPDECVGLSWGCSAHPRMSNCNATRADGDVTMMCACPVGDAELYAGPLRSEVPAGAGAIRFDFTGFEASLRGHVSGVEDAGWCRAFLKPRWTPPFGRSDRRSADCGDGSLELPRLPPGRYEVDVVADGRGLGERVFTATDGVIELSWPVGARFAGR